MSDGALTALVLAGSRGPDDPVARHAGARHKAFVPVAGVPMLLRVVRTLVACPAVGRVALCLDGDASFEAVPELAALAAAGRVVRVASVGTPALSVRRAFDSLGAPLLVATADHPLLTTAMVEHFCAAAPADADLTAAVASATLVRRAYPDAVRTYYRFAGEGYSGCNLFLLRTPAAARAVDFWSRLERHRKRPWRLVSAVGPLTLLRFLLGRLTLEAALERLSAQTGAKVRAVLMPFAEAAIDVDRPADLDLAEAILRRRA